MVQTTTTVLPMVAPWLVASLLVDIGSVPTTIKANQRTGLG
jgi:hypothetical protein